MVLMAGANQGYAIPAVCLYWPLLALAYPLPIKQSVKAGDSVCTAFCSKVHPFSPTVSLTVINHL